MDRVENDPGPLVDAVRDPPPKLPPAPAPAGVRVGEIFNASEAAVGLTGEPPEIDPLPVLSVTAPAAGGGAKAARGGGAAAALTGTVPGTVPDEGTDGEVNEVFF